MAKAILFFCAAMVMSASAVLPSGKAAADEELERIVALVLAATQSAKVQVPSAVGEGRFEHKVARRVDGKEEVRIHERGPFTAAYSGKLDFLKFTYEESDPEPRYDARVYVNDGDRLWHSDFSPRIRPHGADGEICRLIDESEAERLFCVLPHAFPQAWTAIDRFRASNPDANTELVNEGGRPVIVITHAEGYQEKFVIDPARNHHVVEFQMVMPDGRPLIRMQKHWAQTDQKFWYVQKYVHEDLPRDADSGHRVWSMEFLSFKPNVDLPEALFTSDALGLLAGARIIDRTKRPDNIILQVESPKVDRIVLEAVVGPLPKPMPELLRTRVAK
jgi:hypothetical protein